MIQHLARLRTAVIIDLAVPAELSEEVITSVDRLVTAILALAALESE
jgi:hypothetical protein